MSTLTLTFKGKTLHVYPLKDGVVTIGRDAGCDIQIDSLAVEPQHARLMVDGHTCSITQNKHDNATYLNHKPIQEASLQNKDIIRIGKHVLVFHDNDVLVEKNSSAVNVTSPTFHKETTTPAVKEQIKSTTSTNGWLQVMNGEKLGQTFKLRSGLTDLGKLGMLPALIALRSSGYYISSLADNDDNLFVSDQTVGSKSHPLQDGDLIKLGKVTLQFHLQA